MARLGKHDICRRIAEDTNTPVYVVEQFFDSYHEVVMDAVEDGDEVTVMGFGKFCSRLQAERDYVNPQTGEKFTVPEHDRPAFKPGKVFNKRVRGH